MIPDDAKHPVILPRDSLVSEMILRSIHESVGHLGRNSILSEARQHFWIIGASKLIRTLIRKCTICRRYKARLQDQKMADLPIDRTLAGEAPFTRTGVDYFGPF